MDDDPEEDCWDADRRRISLGFRMRYLTCVVLMEESAPAVNLGSAPDGLALDQGERKSLSHVWAHLPRQVMRELVLRQSVPAANGRRLWMAEEKWGYAFDCSAVVVW